MDVLLHFIPDLFHDPGKQFLRIVHKSFCQHRALIHRIFGQMADQFIEGGVQIKVDTQQANGPAVFTIDNDGSGAQRFAAAVAGKNRKYGFSHPPAGWSEAYPGPDQ